jgi:hypothetical protein
MGTVLTPLKFPALAVKRRSGEELDLVEHEGEVAQNFGMTVS